MPRYKTPPHNLEAERSVIGSVFIDNGCLQHIDLSPVDFHATAHQIIWKAILEVSAEKHPVDIVTICNHLKKSNSLEAAGHVFGIAEIVDSVPTAANVSVYVKIMKDKAARRKFIEQMRNLAVQAYDDDPMENIIDEAQVTFRYIMEDLGEKKKTMAEEVREWAMLQDGYFNVTSCYKELHCVTKEQKNAARVSIHRLLDSGTIEKHSEAAGTYRKIDRDLERILWQNGKEELLDIKFPLSLHEYCGLHPGNVMIIAGSKDAGKSAFCLNIAALNYQDYTINYYSSEMWENELRARLVKAEIADILPLEEWKCINFFKRTSNFADVITDTPKTIHIIDFLDITSDFFLIGQMIKDIFDKLKESVVVIAIQKNPGQDLGLGGGRSQEKARIYLSIEGGKAKIVSGKNWVVDGDNPLNPKGLVCEYKLIKGIKFLKSVEWDDEKDLPQKHRYQK